MPTQNKRFMLSVPSDVETDAAEVKRRLFYDKPYSEMYRYLIRKGLDAIKTEPSHSNPSKDRPA